jgi:CheY-like chemotaxis protein
MSGRILSPTVTRSVSETRCRIAVVEDNPPDVLLIEEALRTQSIDCEVVHFRDGEEAYSGLLRSFRDNSFGLLILDLNMPRIGGLELLERLRSQTEFADVPVMVLTSSLSAIERREATRLGATRFVRKPSDLFEFLDQVGSAAGELLKLSGVGGSSGHQGHENA